MAVPKLRIRAGNPDFLDLPWERSVDEWPDEITVEMPTGIHRHPIAFVAYDEGVYAIKELSTRGASHEYDVLLRLEDRTRRSARPVGLVTRPWLDPNTEGAGAIITRYVDYAFPYRELVTGAGFGPRRNQMLDAVAGLLVELHLAGCFWGDCSLSNVLYRYDAGAIETIMVDAETSRLYPTLSDGQRGEDLLIMIENLAGAMADLAAAAGEDIDRADLSLGEDVAARYEDLWDELGSALVVGPDERYRIRERIDRLHDLGFAVGDVVIEPAGAANRVRIDVQVGGRTYHSDRLRELTGIGAAEHQARRILSDIARFEAKHGGGESPTGKAVSTMRWRAGRFEPAVRRLVELRPGFDPLQAYTDFLNYRHQRSAAAGRDIDTEVAFDEWMDAGMPGHDLDGASRGERAEDQ